MASSRIAWFFRKEPEGYESAFGVEHRSCRSGNVGLDLNAAEAMFKYLPEHVVTTRPSLEGREVVIVGPRLTFETPDSSGAVEIAHHIGLPTVSRIEHFRCYPVLAGTHRDEFALSVPRDRVLELAYPGLPASFSAYRRSPRVKEIPLLEEGRAALERFNRSANLGLKPEQIDLIAWIFTAYGRNPTDITLYKLAQMWSDHCWHILFMMMRHIIDGRPMPATLIKILKESYKRIKGTVYDNTQIVLSDNASAVTGHRVNVLVPSRPGQPSEYRWAKALLHVLFSAETHNYPGHVAPYPGAATEIGGEIRDQLGAGCGSEITHSVCARVVGNLCFPDGYRIPGEFLGGNHYSYPSDKAEPMEVIAQGIPGWVGYANAFGVPCTDFQIFSGAVWRPRVVDGQVVVERVESLKPVCYGFGSGTVRDEHKKKAKPQRGWLVVRIGGGAYPIGFCGGSGSSSVTGTNTASFDENAVQRGNPEMERRFYQVILACIAMGKRSPIRMIHDQGAGGLANMSSELIGRAGGNIYLGAVTVNDPTMGDAKVYIAEWQESQGVLVARDRLDEFQAICERENCPCDVIGEITGDGQLTVYHEASAQEVKAKGAAPVSAIATADLLRRTKGFRIEDTTPEIIRRVLIPPQYLTFLEAVCLTLRRSEVASTEWFFRLVDGSVGAKVVKGPFCGPFATAVPGCSVVALSNFGCAGQVTAIGMDPFATCLDPIVGVRLSLGRLYTSLLGGGILDPKLVKVLLNWMWPANIKPAGGEVAMLYRAAESVCDILIRMGTAIIGGKDSSSMATRVDGELVKSLETAVFSSSVPVDDVAVHLTPDIKHPGKSYLVHIDLADGRRRMGGSSFGLALGQLGDYAPDLDDPEQLLRAFPVLYRLTKSGEAVAGCHIEKGGLIATVLRMCFAGDSGVILKTASCYSEYFEWLADELGYVIEVPVGRLKEVCRQLRDANICHRVLGLTSVQPRISLVHNGREVLNAALWHLRREWERTSHHLRRTIVNPEAADQEWRYTKRRSVPVYRCSFRLTELASLHRRGKKPRAVVIREQGCNGHPECAEALVRVGFSVTDATMSDFSRSLSSLDDFTLALFAPGFSYKDILGAAMGWSLRIQRNPSISEIFRRFHERPDTLSLGICNGAQLGLRCGWVLPGLSQEQRPLFTSIKLGRFNHQWIRLRIDSSPSVFLQDMEGSILGAWVANGEGYFNCQDTILAEMLKRQLVPLVYVDASGRRTSALPHSPSGHFVAGVCDLSGRHLYMMPHAFDRCSLSRNWAYMPPDFWDSEESPWVRVGLNARDWCLERR